MTSRRSAASTQIPITVISHESRAGSRGYCRLDGRRTLTQELALRYLLELSTDITCRRAAGPRRALAAAHGDTPRRAGCASWRASCSSAARRARPRSGPPPQIEVRHGGRRRCSRCAPRAGPSWLRHRPLGAAGADLLRHARSVLCATSEARNGPPRRRAATSGPLGARSPGGSRRICAGGRMRRPPGRMRATARAARWSTTSGPTPRLVRATVRRPGGACSDLAEDVARARGRRPTELIAHELAGRLLGPRPAPRRRFRRALRGGAHRPWRLSLDDRRVERAQGGRELGAVDPRGGGRLDLLRPRGRPRGGRTSSASPTRCPRRCPASGGSRRRWPRASSPARRTAIGQRPERGRAERKAELLRECDERARGAGPGGGAGHRRLRGDAPARSRSSTRRASRRRRPHARAPRRAGRGQARRPRGDRHRDAAAVTPASSCSAGDPEQVAEEAARKALTMLDAWTPRRPHAGRGGQRVRRRAAPRGRRATGSSPTRCRSARASTRAARRAARGIVARDRLRRRHASPASGAPTGSTTRARRPSRPA